MLPKIPTMTLKPFVRRVTLLKFAITKPIKPQTEEKPRIK